MLWIQINIPYLVIFSACSCLLCKAMGSLYHLHLSFTYFFLYTIIWVWFFTTLTWRNSWSCQNYKKAEYNVTIQYQTLTKTTSRWLIKVINDYINYANIISHTQLNELILKLMYSLVAMYIGLSLALVSLYSKHVAKTPRQPDTPGKKNILVFDWKIKVTNNLPTTSSSCLDFWCDRVIVGGLVTSLMSIYYI